MISSTQKTDYAGAAKNTNKYTKQNYAKNAGKKREKDKKKEDKKNRLN